MRMRSYVASVCVLAGAVWLAADQHQRSSIVEHSKPTVERVGASVQRGLDQLEERVRHLDATSTRTDLASARDELEDNLSRARDKATKDCEWARAEIDRLDAAARLKDAQEKLAQLGASAKHMKQTGDEASNMLANLKRKSEQAQAAYDSAATRVSRYLH
jgi:DNA repair exonuclease SbcCD ATPase subunit